MKTRALTLIFLSTLLNGVNASSLTLEETVKNLDPFIQSVSLCGWWENKNEQGRYRIISGWLWGHTELYIQWVADPIWSPQKGQKTREEPLIVATATFPEFNSYQSATDFENIQCIEKNGKWVVTADAENGHEHPALKYKLIIHLSSIPGKYKLVEKKSNK